MKNTIKSLAIVLTGPVLLTFIFSQNVIKTSVNRGPAIESKTVHIKSVRENVFNYLVTVK